jgi:YbgC/YbaW family acyl-CoA thioester hydrolase
VATPRVVESEIRVRYAETDAEGVVYYANHFVYMEVARVNYLRALGLNRALWDKLGWGIVIIEASCRYHAPARFDDLLRIRAWVDEVRRSSFAFRYELWNPDKGQLLAEGRTVQVFVDLQTMRPTRLPPDVRDALKAEDPCTSGSAARSSEA